MREIKFRAFYENSQTWVYFTIGGIIDVEALKILNQIAIDGGAWYEFTGLTDKNGKEIYENDIIRYTNVVNEKINGIVKYNDACFDFETEHWRDYLKVIICNHTAEVIGNIYQNKELLK